ncbi:MAG: hypothetical protein L6R39_004644 [Caloplaca ligustica]|nr:MAG: hypothetical protein L6R39_004644 [Caloplaca ligustica]
MKVASVLAVVAVSAASTVSAKHGDIHATGLEHRHLHHKGRTSSAAETGNALELDESSLDKRTGQCQFPEDAGLVPVPGGSNGGWAMSPDQCCEPGGYCPYACPPGQVSMQWDPKATSYTYPQSMLTGQNGGLFCDKNGKIQKPFPNRPYCADGTGNVGCHNKASGNVAICQTVLPGNEAMLIPTIVENTATLAIPGPEYWAGTSAHFYVNPPGVTTEEGCIWGTVEKPQGNWAPYVLGGNTVDSGETFIKLGWNPIYLEPATPFRDEKPTFAIEIICEGDGCNGLPCAIDPSQHGVNEIVGGGSFDGAGGAASCVVTVAAGSSAKYVISELGGSGNGNGNNGGGSEGRDAYSNARTDDVERCLIYTITNPNTNSHANPQLVILAAVVVAVVPIVPAVVPIVVRVIVIIGSLIQLVFILFAVELFRSDDLFSPCPSIYEPGIPGVSESTFASTFEAFIQASHFRGQQYRNDDGR